jgi:hypothetical protein
VNSLPASVRLELSGALAFAQPEDLARLLPDITRAAIIDDARGRAERLAPKLRAASPEPPGSATVRR